MKENSKNEYLINQKNNNTTNKEKMKCDNDTDTIIAMIVNKIITKAMNVIRSKETSEKMTYHCYDYLVNNVNSFLKSQFFTYDNELDWNKDKIFLNNKPEKFEKEFNLIPEPITPGKDRNNSNWIKIINNKINNKRVFLVNKAFEPIESQKSSLSDLINIGNLLENKNEKNQILEETNVLKEKNSDNINLDNDNSTTSLINENLIISLPCTDLEEDKYTNIYLEQNKNKELNPLRKEMEIEMIIKKAEKNSKKKEKKKEKQPSNILNLKKIKKIKHFNSNDLSFDPQGNIIKKKLISIDSLSKDFSFAKYQVNNINKKIKKTFFKLEQSKSEENNITIKANLMKVPRSTNLLPKNYRKFSEQINPIKIENKEPMTHRNNIVQKIEFNPKDIEKEDINKKSKSKRSNEVIKEIMPFNYCNDKMILEPGVVLKSQITKKTGGKEFFRKYNRPSMKEFNNFILKFSSSKPTSVQEMAKSTESTNNGLISTEKVNEINESNLKYNGYNQNFEDSNPLIKGANSMITKSEEKFKILNPKYINNKIKFKKMKGSKTRILSNYKIKGDKWRINNFSDSMVLNNNIQSTNSGNFDNLYNYLSERNAYKNFDFSSETSNTYINYKMKSTNDILKNVIHERIKHKKSLFPTIKDKKKEKIDFNNNSERIDQMQKFNLKIINDVNFDIWGNNSESILTKSYININNIMKPSSLFKNINLSKIDSKRERKNIRDFIQKSDRKKFDNLYLLGLKNNDNSS